MTAKVTGPVCLSSHEENMLKLAELAINMTTKTEHEVFKLAARKILDLLPVVKYIRFLLTTENGIQTDSFEVSDNICLARGLSALGLKGTAQQAAMQSGKVYCSETCDGEYCYHDWRMLRQKSGLESILAIPLLAAESTFGVLTVAAKEAHTFTRGDREVLETVASLVAPFAAMMAKQQHMEVTRMVIKSVLPGGVVSMINEHMGWSTPQELQF